MKLALIVVVFGVGGVNAVHAQLAKAIELNDQGNKASEVGRPDEAIGFYRDALAIWRASGPEYDPHRAGTLFNLGVALTATGSRVEGSRILEQALELHRKTLGSRNRRTVGNMTLLASNYLLLGRDAEAEALYQESLGVTRELFPKDVQVARALEGLSSLRIRQDKTEEGLAMAKEALEVAIQATGEESLDAALAYANMAEAHRAAGQLDRAWPLVRRSRALYEKSLGPGHPRVASLVSLEGLLLLQDGKTANAEQLLADAVNRLEQNCPKCSAEIALAQHNLALLRIRQGRYPDADQLLTKVVALREGYTAVPGTELADTLRLLAAVRNKEKRFDEAKRLETRAQTILSYR